MTEIKGSIMTSARAQGRSSNSTRSGYSLEEFIGALYTSDEFAKELRRWEPYRPIIETKLRQEYQPDVHGDILSYQRGLLELWDPDTGRMTQHIKQGFDPHAQT